MGERRQRSAEARVGNDSFDARALEIEAGLLLLDPGVRDIVDVLRTWCLAGAAPVVERVLRSSPLQSHEVSLQPEAKHTVRTLGRGPAWGRVRCEMLECGAANSRFLVSGPPQCAAHALHPCRTS